MDATEVHQELHKAIRDRVQVIVRMSRGAISKPLPPTQLTVTRDGRFLLAVVKPDEVKLCPPMQWFAMIPPGYEYAIAACCLHDIDELFSYAPFADPNDVEGDPVIA